MATTRLARLLAPDAVASLLDAAGALVPDASIVVHDAGGPDLARRGPKNVPGATAPAARPIVVGDETVGEVRLEGAGDPAVAAGVVSLLAASLSTAAAEADARRAVTAGALDDLRELALRSRLAQTVGSAVDPASIANLVAETIARPLRADVTVVIGSGDRSHPTFSASIGDPADVARVAEEARPVLERLHAEDPIQGACADGVEPEDGGPFGSILAGVLRTSTGTQGSIVLARRRGAAPFDETDRRLLAAVASETAIALERGALQQEILGRRRLDDELAIGRRIQRSLMPRRFPDLPGWEIAAAYEAAREVGGDLYDVFKLDSRADMLAFTVADVTGKGIPAAILMADTRALIHAAADHTTDPADTLGRVNLILREERATSLFVTVAHGLVDVITGGLTLASAGHDPLHVIEADGRLVTLETGGRLIGMVADIQARTVERTLRPGDALVAHTDGVTEARSPDGGFYGEERFEQILASLAGRSASEIVDAVVADVAAFRGDAEPSDDLTLLVIRRQAVPAGS